MFRKTSLPSASGSGSDLLPARLSSHAWPFAVLAPWTDSSPNGFSVPLTLTSCRWARVVWWPPCVGRELESHICSSLYGWCLECSCATCEAWLRDRER